MKKADVFVQAPRVQVADKSSPPILFPTVPSTFFHAIGALVTQWAVMEQEMNILIRALHSANKTDLPGLTNAPFEKKFDTFRQQWALFTKDIPDLESFASNTIASIQKGRVLRNDISHREMVLGMRMDGNHFVQFYNTIRYKQKSKPYYVTDFLDAAKHAEKAAGWMVWVTESDSVWPLSESAANRLRQLPNMDLHRLPT